MTNGYMIITEKDWEKSTPEQQGWMMFNTVRGLSKRVKSLEKKHVFDRIVLFIGGGTGIALVSIFGG